MTNVYTPQTLLVTGGCGFIGSNYVRWVLENDSTVQVLNLDALTYAGNLGNLTDLQDHPRYQFFKGSITDRAFLEELFRSHNPDAVINFAAESHVDRSILDSGPFIETNIVGTQTLLDVSRAHQVKRYVQVSTDEVYGSLGAEGLFSETTPLAPNSPYSASKAAADMLVRSYCHTYQFPGITTRCSNNYGPYQFPEKLIPLFIANALEGKSLPVYGDGKQVRDWIYVNDHCRGVDMALRKGTLGEVYNFGGRCELENIRLIQTLLAKLSQPESLITYVKDRPGHDRRYAIDCTKAEQQLGWQPLTGFEEGLQQTIDWYLSNGEWMNTVRSGEYQNYYEQQYCNRLNKPA